MTAVAGATFTAAAFNTHVRDNLNETAPAKATAPSQLFVSTGPNAIATRVPSQAFVPTPETTASSAYTDLATPGPSVSVTTGTIAIVFFAAQVANNVSDSASWSSVRVTGASTVAASDAWSIQADGITANNSVRYGMTHVFTGLTPGVNTFAMQYRVGSNTATFRNREISVIPL
jgi:hypothetical protein